MYIYENLLEALKELNAEELKQPVVVVDTYEPDDGIYSVSATDSNDKYGGIGMKPFKERLPIGQKVIVLDGKYIQSKEDIIV